MALALPRLALSSVAGWLCTALACAYPAVAQTTTAVSTPDSAAPHDSLGLREATTWLTDSLPRVASFTLHDRLNGQPVADAARTLSDVHIDGCTVSWIVGTVSPGVSSRVKITANLTAVDPALVTVVRRDTIRAPAGRLIHDPPVWEMTAPTRDGSSPVSFENTTNNVHLTLPTLDLFVGGRDDAWRTAAAIASLTRACQQAAPH